MWHWQVLSSLLLSVSQVKLFFVCTLCWKLVSLFIVWNAVISTWGVWQICAAWLAVGLAAAWCNCCTCHRWVRLKMQGYLRSPCRRYVTAFVARCCFLTCPMTNTQGIICNSVVECWTCDQNVVDFIPSRSSSSVQDGIYGLGKAHICSTPSLSTYLEVSPVLPLKQFQHLSDWLWPSLILSSKIVECFLLLSMPLSSRWLKVWCPWLCACW